MKNYTKRGVLIIFLMVIGIAYLVFNLYSDIKFNISNSNGEIHLRFKIPNPEQVDDIKLSYKIYFLDNYKNVSHSEIQLSLDDSSSEYTLKVDPHRFWGMKDQIDFTLEVTYKNGSHKKSTIAYSRFLNDISNAYCVEPEVIDHYNVYTFEGICAKISLVDLPENVVLYKSYSNPKEVFYIGFKYNAYLYPIKEYKIVSKTDYLINAGSEHYGTKIPFSNETSNDNRVLLNNMDVDHPWPGLFPFDEKGGLIEHINDAPFGLNLVTTNGLSKVYQNSIDKYSEYFQKLSDIEFSILD